MTRSADEAHAHQLLEKADTLRTDLGESLHDRFTESIYSRARAITLRAVTTDGSTRRDWDQTLDRLLTSRTLGFPIMLAILAGVFWLTIQAANVPSGMLASAFFWLEERLSWAFQVLGAPWWLEGFFVHGVYRGLAWVVSVMLPPMAIFFPIFTLLEDMGYLPRVVFNLDRFFRLAGAHGKQALTMSMGFGCNAAGVIACRI
ncbi:MAG: nucleoside recognition domain-containing protein, partial [Nitrospinota bacterium]